MLSAQKCISDEIPAADDERMDRVAHTTMRVLQATGRASTQGHQH